MASVGAWVQAQCWVRNAFKQLNSYSMASQPCNSLCEIFLCVVLLLNVSGPISNQIWARGFLSIPRLNSHPSRALAIPRRRPKGLFHPLGRSQIFCGLHNGAGSND